MVNNDALVSIIVPTYNAAPYIASCIASLMAQDYSNIEIIVVDDGSDDGTAEKAENINDSRIRVLRLPHVGVSRARNAGLEAANGEYIIFIDGDDMVEPHHLSTLVGGLSPKADCSMIQMQIDFIDGRPSELDPVCSAIYHNNTYVEKEDFAILFDNYLLSSPCNKIYKTSIIKDNDIRFDEKISYAEDLVFNLQYFRHISCVRMIPAATYHYIKYPTSSTGRFHLNTAYTLGKIEIEAAKTITNPTEDSKLIFLKHIMWGLVNISNTKSPLSSREATNEIRRILRLPTYDTSLTALHRLGINKILGLLLRLKSANLIYQALHHRFSK